jgi:diguanylate cyclase
MAVAKTALKQIEALRLPADPINFELWYTYALGQNPRLNAAINQLLEQRGTLMESELERLHAEHLSSRRFEIQLENAAQEFAEELAQVVERVGEASASSKLYSIKLDVGAKGLDSNQTLERLKTVVHALVTATKEMEAKNLSLEERLEDAREKTEELQLRVEKTRFEIAIDSLTQLGNRRYFDETLARMIDHSRKAGSPLTLLMADIDHFKRFNDTYGHSIGDDVLRVVAANIKAALRADAVACRYGGEEFAVILRNADAASSKMVAERIREAVSSKELKKRSTDQVLGRVTISIGVVQLRDGESAAELIERADECMYAAKHAGRNRVVCETTETQSRD